MISLLIAVILFRTFLAEGYMISTGSMAPALLGYHKRVVCPTCTVEFPFGVAYDTDDLEHLAADDARRQIAICPNCGQPNIQVSEVSRNHGDQLLVFKQSYLYRDPHRWEVVVFRNPSNPLEAFVKRVAGLPGEVIQVIDGDIHVNGTLCRKTWQEQIELRIPVHKHLGTDDRSAGVHPHWTAEAGETDDDPPWQTSGSGFRLKGRDRSDLCWVNYAHWVRRGGQHQTSVSLMSWPAELDSESAPPAGLKYDREAHRLSCVGALPEPVRDRLCSLSKTAVFQAAVQDLYEQSHMAPVNDFYGYNSSDQQQPPTVVRDLMWSGRVQVSSGKGEFRVEMSTGPHDFAAVFDFHHRDVRLHMDEQEEPVSTGNLPLSLKQDGALVEMSLFDQQVLVAVDGVPVLPAFAFDTSPGGRVTRHPVRFGGRGIDVDVDDIRLFRDVFYTPEQTRHGVAQPYRLKKDEFFVLGDNSPVSHDSRRWDAAGMPRHLLVGKPFLVHLPSKPGRLQVGNQHMQLRLPDVDRIRLLK
ncbi:MAG: signal peptidase I [Planctomycetaceae bacterium]